jgi:hypothetical protein
MPEKRKKRNVPYRKIEVGQKVQGVYLGFKEREREVKETGEFQTMRLLTFCEPDDEDTKFSIMGSKGLQIALESAEVKEGELIEIERLPDTHTKAGNKIGQYDIFSL